VETADHFAELLLPLPVSGTFTYHIPDDLIPYVFPGGRVVVQFGKRKLYTALVQKLHDHIPDTYKPKEILSALDQYPIVVPVQVKFWQWIAAYYICHEGEVMNAALPSAFKLSSESSIMLHPSAEFDFSELNEKEQLLVEALHHRKSIEISEVAKMLNQQKIIPMINTLLEQGIILMEEQLSDRYKPKIESYVQLNSSYLEDEKKFEPLFGELEKKARKQLDLLMSYLVLSKYGSGKMEEVTRSKLLQTCHTTGAVLDGLIKKRILEIHERVISRINYGTSEFTVDSIILNELQKSAFEKIHESFHTKDVVLLHGVTSSGKTEIYIKCIQEALDRGEQVLYLLPEIALTSHIIIRLKKYFGERIGVYHSRFNENERFEIWNKVLSAGKGSSTEKGNYNIVLGARSAIFLPFSKLGLVIVDEEHDSSFKQYDPSPRYNARDAALYLAHLHNAKAIIGSATPSIESYFNCQEGKYALVEMMERYGNMEMPEIEVVDIRNEIRWKKMKSHFSSVLMKQLSTALESHQQAILFQNRRGFSLRLECESCSWMPACKNCDVTLVYHKASDQLRCHYCGYTSKIPDKCPVCKNTDIRMKGFGTEKVEEELKTLLPEAKIVRMDLDTMRSKQAHLKLLTDFEQKKIDILVGTQMVTKGLDFENVSTVSILNADNMLSFPDFRAAERSFQLMSQVSGRSGRKHNRGKVIIQTRNPKHPIILDVVNHDYTSMYQHELVDRRKFNYPPYYRLVQIHVKHKDPQVLNTAATELVARFRKEFGKRVLGPEYPLVSRIKNYFIKQIMVKIERNSSQMEMKARLVKVIEDFFRNKAHNAVKLVIDVDPQ
jgi:primosomal protein N' (replication factor Y) (superfamily II helicase)